jgi:hypothetical protein
MLTMTTPHLDPFAIRALAAELRCDPRSIVAELAGRRVRGAAGEIIRQRLQAMGMPYSAQQRLDGAALLQRPRTIA